MRVVSLVPSVTETLLAWGVEPVAVTRFCEQPGYPTVGGTKNPDVEAIVALRPDLVVLDKEENTLDAAAALDAAGVPLHVLHVRGRGDVAGALAGLATAVGVDVAPIELPTACGGLPAGPGSTPRAWVPIWRRPWMTINGGTYGSSLLTAAGVANVFADHPDPYPEVDLDEVRRRDPDVVLAPSEPYPFAEKHRVELEAVAPVVWVDGKDLFWWGARTPGASARLAVLVAGLGLPGRAGPDSMAPGG